MKLRERLGLTPERQQRATRAMQVALVGLVFVGLNRGAAGIGIVVNASLALVVTFLPAVLERDYHIPMDAGLTLWIAFAVFLHAVGTVGIPGWSETSFYAGLPWWDHLTHTLSSSVVAAAGYATARALDEHSEAIYLPERFMFVFILLFVVAFGVLWEVIEFAVSGVAALAGTDSVLTQYGLADTMLDLLFDTLGGVIVAVWGTARLGDVASALSAHLGRTRS